MKFIDRTEIHIKSGHGGKGMVSFHAARNRPKLGPDGGNGGPGGDVYLIGESGLNSLSCFRYRHYYSAEDGGKGGVNGRTGRAGKNLYLKVPLGTIVYDRDSGKRLGELAEHGKRLLVASGGCAGLGNLRFLSATHQAPEESTPGGEGVALTLRLELKLMADVGFAGFPNAGKSTLISRISAARPKIGDYPFTTLTPNLGVVDLDDGPNDFRNRSFVAADIPGLIEGAGDGRGLGIAFLRHLERTRVIAYVIECCSFSDDDPLESYEKLRKELRSYSEQLASKPAIVVLTKLDAVSEDFELPPLVDRFDEIGLKAVAVSSLTGKGLTEFKRLAYDMVVKKQLDDTVSHEYAFTDDDPQAQGYRVITRSDYFSELQS